MRANLCGWVGLVIGVWCVTGQVMAQEVGPAASPGTLSSPAVGTPAQPTPGVVMHTTDMVHPGDVDHVEVPVDDSSSGFFLDAEYLFMQPRRQALDFAIVSPTANGTPQGSVESLEWDWNSGLRLGGGFRLPAEGWEMGVFYTYLHSNASRSLAAPAGGTLDATLTSAGPVEQVDTATAESSINYNVFDLEISRIIPLQDSFALRVFGGGRYAWIDQSLTALYNGGDATNDVVSSPINFNGGGVRVGGEGVWKFGRGFTFFARASGSLLIGNVKTSLLETNNNGGTTLVNVTDNFEQVVPVTELSLGLTWQWRQVTVTAGYEVTDWFNMVSSPDFVSDVDAGKIGRRTSDLSLDGFTARVEWDF